MNCKNCGHYIEDRKFCGHCGQRSTVSRINFSNFLTEFSESVFQVNKGFFFTIKELFIRPGDSLKAFLRGERKKYFKPIAYVLTLSTIYFLISRIAHQNTWLNDLLTGWMESTTEKDKQAQAPIILVWFSNNYAYSSLLLLPIFSLASYLSFLKSDTNYFEHIVINAYITGQQAFFYAFFIVVRTFIDNDVMEMFPLLVAVAYTFWVFWQFFSKGNRLLNIFFSVITYLLYLVFSLGLVMILMGINELIYK